MNNEKWIMNNDYTPEKKSTRKNFKNIFNIWQYFYFVHDCYYLIPTIFNKIFTIYFRTCLSVKTDTLEFNSFFYLYININIYYLTISSYILHMEPPYCPGKWVPYWVVAYWHEILYMTH